MIDLLYKVLLEIRSLNIRFATRVLHISFENYLDCLCFVLEVVFFSSLIILILGRRNNLSMERRVYLWLSCCYVSIVLSYTIVMREPMNDYRANPEIFWSYTLALKGNRIYIREIFLNMCMLVPMGILLPAFFNRLKYLCVISVLFPAFIEIVQLLSKRGLFETDDIISNLIGFWIGWGIRLFGVKIKSVIVHHFQEKS